MLWWISKRGQAIIVELMFEEGLLSVVSQTIHKPLVNSIQPFSEFYEKEKASLFVAFRKS